MGPQGNWRRLVPAGCWLLLLYGEFLQRWGQITFDTKFDLTADPGRFMARSLHLWNQQSSFGELQNQAYGYLFPQGTFALAGHLVGLPDWVTQRLWSSLLLILAFEGARRLFRALAPDQAAASVAAGLAFAWAPRLLGLSGVLTAEVLPTAALPWVVLPLVLVRQGRLGVRAGALLSGAAVLLMGGVNAVENLAALPLPLFVVLTWWRQPYGKRLLAWWCVATAAAASWWIAPLLVLGKYSPPFLDYIETSPAVTRPLGWFNVLRGADHWLSFVHVGDEPWWRGAYLLSTQPILIVATALVAAVSLWGLLRRDMPLRGPLIASLLVGLVCLTIARTGPWESPLHTVFQQLLDGGLSMLRNVHKVDPLIRLPLALGLGHVVGLLLRAAAGSRGRARTLRWAALVAVLGVLASTAFPLFTGQLRKEGWSAIPSYWTQAAAYLGHVADGRTTLVLPGSGFGQQSWGWTIDEPIQGVARSPWVTRSQVPLTPGQTIRYLDAIEERDDDGLGSPSLAPALARAGVGFVLVRRDLDISSSGAPTTSRVDKSLGRSPGMVRVASFGHSDELDQPMIDIYRVTVPGGVPRVEAQPLANAVTLVGGPEDILTALEQGAIPADRPVLVESPAMLGGRAPDVVGDGYRLRERQFGRVHDAVSQIMAPAEPYRLTRSANDYPGVPGVPRVYATYDVATAITASSSAGYADSLGPTEPELGPYSAFDGLPMTQWQSAPFIPPRGQWVQVAYKAPRPITRVEIDTALPGVSAIGIRQVEVRAGGLTRSATIDPASGIGVASFPGQPARQLRVTVTRTSAPAGPVGIRAVIVDGSAIARTLVIPDSGADAHTDFVMRARPHRRACVQTAVGPSCLVTQGRDSEEEGGILRQFTLHTAATYRPQGWAVARTTPATARLLAPIGGQVAVSASSVFENEPGVSGQLAYDGNLGTSWIASPYDLEPTLTLSWKRPATLRRLQVVPAGGATFAPTAARITTRDGQHRYVDLSGSGLGYFNPLRTTGIRLQLLNPHGPAGQSMGVAELRIQGLDGQRYDLSPTTVTGSVCGLGPTLTVDGRAYRTRVTGYMSDVLDGGPLRVQPCVPLVHLGAGTHRLDFASTEQFQPIGLDLRPGGARESPALPDRAVRIERWTTMARTVMVGPGSRAVLRIPENRNQGWVATLAGHRLAPITVDGWQQGFVVPAGAGGVVHLTFAPDQPYRLGLLGGGILALVVLVGGIVLSRREQPSTSTAPGAARPWKRLAWLAVAVLAYLAAGPMVLAGLVLGWVLRLRLSELARLAMVLYCVAAIGAAFGSAEGMAPDWVDALAGVVVGLVVAAGGSRSRRPVTPEGTP